MKYKFLGKNKLFNAGVELEPWVDPTPPLPSGWVDITAPSYWTTPLASGTVWTGTQWDISTAGGYGPDFGLFATADTKVLFDLATQIRVTGTSANSLYIRFFPLEADWGAFPTIFDAISGQAYTISAYLNNQPYRDRWWGLSPSDRFTGNLSHITMMEIFIP
jgi:hypothetical protein